MSAIVKQNWREVSRLDWIEIAALVAASVTLLLHGLSMVGDARIDDAYITFAYAKNLAHGRGPIYGYDLKVEGYSNFLWMVLTGLGEWVGVSALTTARALGHAAFAFILAATYGGARKLAGRVPAIMMTLVLAASTDFHRLIQTGLETVLYSAFIAGGAVHYVLEDKLRRRWSGLWFAGAALTRIDGFVPLGLILGLELLRVLLAEKKADVRALLFWAGVAVAPVAVFWLWRYAYYGLLFPLPYYAKASQGMLEFERGADYVVNGLRETGLWVAVIFAVFGASLRSRPPTLVIFAFLALFSGYVAYVGGDWMPYNRMLVPLWSPLLVLSALGVERVLNELKNRANVLKSAAVAGPAVACGFMALHLNQITLDTPLERGKVGHTNHLLRHTQGLLDALPYVQAMVRKPGDKLVTDYGGVYAYGTDASVIEMWGLANKDIALRGNTDGIAAIYGKTCVPCYAEFQPDYFHSVTPLLRGDQDFASPSALIAQIFQGHAIDRVIGLRRNYVMGRVRNPQTGQTLWFMERKRDGVSFEPRQVGQLVVDYPTPQLRGRRR